MRLDNFALPLLFKYVRCHRWRVVLLSLVFAASTALFILAPQALSRFIDSVHGQAAQGGALLAILLYLAAILARGAMSALLKVQLSAVGQRITDAHRRDVMQHFLSMDMQHLGGWTSGEAITRLDEDVEGLFSYYFVLFYKLLGSGLALLGILAVLAFRSGWLCAALFAISMLAILGFKAIQDRGIAKYVRRSAAVSSFNGIMKEMLDNAGTLRALRAEAFAETRIKGAMLTRFRESLPASLMYGNLWSASTIMQGAVVASGLLAALLLWDAGFITIGMAYLIYTYSEMIIEPLQDFRNHMGSMQGAKAGILRTQALLAIPAMEDHGVLTLDDEAPALKICDLRFAYTGGADVLRGVSLTVPAGGRLGIMGETGCGKSTLIGLIAGLNPYETGSIRLQGRELREIRRQNLRARVAFLTQRVQLIHGTLRDNITLFDARHSDDDIYRAIGRLHLLDWFEKFSQGLDARLELAEGSLSSGEARLVSVIRLALSKPRLVLLDEMTAGLDAATERRVSRAVEALCADCTVVAIAHAAEALDWMDTIVRMENGVLETPQTGGPIACE